MSVDLIRNFCIIAHIDHGKSTLADRLIEHTKTLHIKEMRNQVLDDMDIERERGITIKSHPISIDFKYKDKQYMLNLIDTPGHVDFGYEVSRSLAACEGALLLIDASQGVEAQTVTNAYLAIEAGLEIIPIINKVDMKNADIDSAIMQTIELLGCKESDIICVSAKNGTGINKVFDAIINIIPAPIQDRSVTGTRGLIFDCIFDKYRGVISYVRVFNGKINKGMTAKYFANSNVHEILEVGKLKLDKIALDSINQGEVGYVITNNKDVSEIKVGDTMTLAEDQAKKALEGYKDIKPMVFSGIYPVDNNDYDNLRESLNKLKINDSALSYEPNSSTALGFGFRCGFLGPLHLEIVQERLEREYNLDLISTAPNVNYRLERHDSTSDYIDNPSEMPNPSDIKAIYEPIIQAEIISPSKYIGNIMKLCLAKRGVYIETKYITTEKVQLIFEIPFGEIIFDFFEKLQSLTQGYASFDYEVKGEKKSRLQKLDILIANEQVDALSLIVHVDKAYKQGSSLCKKLKKEIKRHQFSIPIQASIGSKIIARETINAFRKNVIAKCYGGDISRKRKLLEKQKEGKKRMKQIGNVEIPQKAFLAVLRNDEE
ncbi:MAG: elongation factor 4 [Candidatus Marinimicrobia bacterium]|nr:elongation factor 4 [Candidatus Neomarinimicrobiota bacterium]|tara:strand:+ start:5885 stop:7687 length:1803 start_codon:yes stop_codon:yes gene_type:complete